MTTVAVIQSSWDASNVMRSSYQHNTQDNRIILANFKWLSSVLIVNLDNFPQILKIDCSIEDVVLTFDNSISSSSAYETWKNQNDWAIFLGHENRCRGIGESIVLKVLAVSLATPNHIMINTKNTLEISKVLIDYDLDVRELIPRSLQKRVVFKSFKFGINYDLENDRAKRDEIQIRPITAYVGQTKATAAVTLKNCYVKGNVDVGINIKSGMSGYPQYRLNMTGRFKANMDVGMQFVTSHPIQEMGTEFPFTLGKLPLYRLSVPGIFQLAPMLTFDTSFNINVPDKFDLGFGVDHNYDFSFVANSNPDHVLQKSTVKFISKYTVNPHSFSSSMHSYKVSASARMAPKVSLSLRVFGKQQISFSLESNNTFGIATKRDILSCPTKELSSGFFKSDSAEFAIALPGDRKSHKNVWDSGQISIKCSSCDSCFNPSSPKLSHATVSLAQTTSVAEKS